MTSAAHTNALARLFTVVIGLLLWWPAMGQVPQLQEETAVHRGDSSPEPTSPVDGDSLAAEEAAESDDRESERESTPPANLVARQAELLVHARPIDRTHRDELAPASTWTVLARERGPPLS